MARHSVVVGVGCESKRFSCKCVLSALIGVMMISSGLVLFADAADDKGTRPLQLLWESDLPSDYSVARMDATIDGMVSSYFAPNNAQGLETYFGRDGVRVASSIEETQSWVFGIKMTGFGRDTNLAPIDELMPVAADNRIEYDCGDLAEWFENTPEGIEHGFVVNERISGEGDLVLEAALRGNCVARLADWGDAIEIFSRNGIRVLRYDSLEVFDAMGSSLPARLDQYKNCMRIVICDSDAVYPITIDPLLCSPYRHMTGPTLSGYGFCVSDAGDVNGDGYDDVIVGMPACDFYVGDQDFINAGAARIEYGGTSGDADWLFMDINYVQAYAGFGSSVSSAGDVNGDGYDDVIVGEPYWDRDEHNLNEGRAHVYYGPSFPLYGSPDWTIEDSGKFVSSAGDVNGDGYGDVIISQTPSYGGGFEVYYGSSSGLPTSPSWSEHYPYYCSFATSAGDVNGDGYGDVITGQALYDNGQQDEGCVRVYLGSSAGLLAAPSWTVEGNLANVWFGSSISAAGDVNGDGYDDVIVGAPGYDFNSDGQIEGRSFVYCGSSGGLSAMPSWTVDGDQPGSEFGVVSDAGDVNGDTFDDVIVSARYYSNGQSDEGRVFVYDGSPTGLATSPSWIAEGNSEACGFGLSISSAGDFDGDGYDDVIISAYETVGTFIYKGWTSRSWTAESDVAGSFFGGSVSSAGDVNGDGYGDVIVGAPLYVDFKIRGGRAYIYLGSVGGLSSTPIWSAFEYQVDAHFGSWVSSAGDVNGDGYDDLIIGAPYYDNGELDEGRAFVYLGGAGIPSGALSWTAEANQAEVYFGRCVSSAGDVNGDGYDDVIVGAPYYDNGELDEGRAYVYCGSPSGLSTTPSWTAEGDQAGANFGFSVSAGDVNFDGYDDVIISAPCYSNDESQEGRVFVYHGSAAGLSATPSWTAEGNQAGANFGWSVSSSRGLLTGYDRVIIGAPNYDGDQVDEGRVFCYAGSVGGLQLAPYWTVESDQAGASFGYSVSFVGDFNGDGYLDSVVGAPYYDNDQINEGRVFYYEDRVLTGSDESHQPDAMFGRSVSSAGDVNGDWYDDLIVGAPLFRVGGLQVGRACVYLGWSALHCSVIFTQSGLLSDASGTVLTVNGVPKSLSDLPFHKFYDSGTTISYSYTNVLPTGDPGKRYLYGGVTGPTSPFIVTGPATITGNYRMQHHLTVNNGGHGGASGQNWYTAGEAAQYAIYPTEVCDTAWTYTTGNYVDSVPAVANGVVYFGSVDRKFYALDASSGGLLWSYATGSGILSSPCVANGMVYFGSADGRVYALDALTGALEWTFTTSGVIEYASPLVSGSRVYIGSDDGYMYALDASLGSLIWSHNVKGQVQTRPAVADGKLYVASLFGLFALNADTGAEIWCRSDVGELWSSPAVVGGKVYFGSDDFRVYALDALTGVTKWIFTTGNWVESSPAVANGRVFVGSYDKRLYALDAASGSLLWDYEATAYIYSSPCVVGNIVYFGSADHLIRALDTFNGEVLWSHVANSWVDSSPAVSEGMLYIGAGDGKLYALNIDRWYEFMSWSGDSSSTNPKDTILMDGPKSITAVWEERSTSNLLTVNNGGHGRTSGTGSYDYGAVASFSVDSTRTCDAVWIYPTGHFIDSSPAVSDGKVYIGSYDSKLYALNLDGTLAWSYLTGGPVQSSPAVVDGMVYFGSWDRNVYALDASTGALAWKYETGGTVYYSSPTVADGRIFIGSADGKIYAINTDGTLAWSYATGSRIDSTPAVSGSMVYVGSMDNAVYALDASTGAFVWAYSTGGMVRSSPVVADGKVFFGSYDDKVYALDASTGALVWSYTTGGDVWSSPAVADGRVCVGSGDGKIYALDASTGAPAWTYTAGSYVRSSPTVVESRVYVGSMDGRIHAVALSDGTLVWKYTTDGAISSSPTVFDHTLYVGSEDHNIYALSCDEWYVFTGWSGDSSSTSPSDAIRMNGTKTVSANWLLAQTSYRLFVDNGGHGTTTGTAWYKYKSTASFSIDPTRVGNAKWNYLTGGYVDSSPTVENGIVYFGSFDGKIYAVDASSGALVWSYTTGGTVASSPCVANGVVYVGSYDKRLYALDAMTGALEWSFLTSAWIEYASPVVVGPKVYFGSCDGYLYAVDTLTGLMSWSHNVLGQVQTRPAVVGGNVYVTSFGGVHALNANTGAEIWSRTDVGPLWSSPTVANGKVYFGSDDFNVYALDASNGATLWTFTTGKWVESSPEYANGMIYVGSDDKYLYALNAATGALVWNYPTGAYIYSSPCFSNGVVYFGSADSSVYALNALTGARLWSYKTGTWADSSPIVSGGMVYIGSCDHRLYAFAADTFFEFAGWSGDSSSATPSASILMDGTKTVVATWELRSVLNHLDVGNGGHGTTSGTGSYVFGSNAAFSIDQTRVIDLAWARPTDDWVDSSPAVAYGFVYFGSFDNRVYAVSAVDGILLWSYLTGGDVASSPCVAYGVVYVGSYDGKLYAIDAFTGALKWAFPTSGPIEYASPVVVGSKVYFGSGDGYVRALDTSDGALLWTHTVLAAVETRPAVVDGIVYVSSLAGMFALNADTGAEVWKRTDVGELWSSPAVYDGKVYFGSDDYKVYALDSATGATRWTYSTGHWVESSPAVVNGKVYVGSNDHNMYALDAGTGALVWSFTANDYIYSSPSVSRGVVYFGSADSKVYALDATSGRLLWTHGTGSWVDSSPAFVNGWLYIGSCDGKLHALKVDKWYSFAGWSGDSSSTGQSGTILMDGPKTVTAVWQTWMTHAVKLVKGWNFVTVPAIGFGYKASTLGLQRMDIVVSWNPATSSYDRSFIIGVSPPALDFDIQPSTGYWILAGSDETLYLHGYVASATQIRTVTVPAGGGWVNIAFNTLNTTWKASMVPGMFSGGSVKMVAWYNATLGSYKTYITGIPQSDFTLIPGQAYWIMVTSSGTLTYNP